MSRVSMLFAFAALATLLAVPLGAQEIERLQHELRALRSEVDALKDVARGGGGEDLALAVKLRKHVFSWATEDGKFSFTMNVRTQVRVTYSDEFGQETSSGDGAAVRALSTDGRDVFNFRIRRLKLSMGGNIFEKEFKYAVGLQFTNNALELAENVVFTWARWAEFNVNAGQEKIPFNYSQLVSSGRQQFVDRSVVDSVFNQDYGKGLWLSGVIGKETPWVKYWVGIYNGRLRANNDFRNADKAINTDAFSAAGPGSVDADLMPALRVETHPLGNVADDMTDLRSREESKKVLFSVGIAMNWFISRFTNTALRPALGGAAASPGSGRSNTGHDTINLTIDGHFRFYGLSLNIEFIHRHTEFHNFGPLEGNNVFRGRAFPGDLTDNGLLVEIGFFILPKQLDVGLRFGMVDADEFWLAGSTNKPNGIRPDSLEMGLTVGYYLQGHNLKIQMDFTYVSYQLVVNAGTVPSIPSSGNSLPTRSASSIANDTSDWLHNWQWRVQIQWIF